MTPAGADDPGGDVASPCTSVCRMDPALGDREERRAGGLCAGCLRTLDEVVAWASASNATRRDVLARVAVRRSHADRR